MKTLLSFFFGFFILLMMGGYSPYSMMGYGNSYYNQPPLWYESANDYVYEPYWQYPISSYPNYGYTYGLGYGSGYYGGYGSGYNYPPSSQQHWKTSLWYTLWADP